MMSRVLVMRLEGNGRMQKPFGGRCFGEVGLTFVILSPDVREVHEGPSLRGSHRDRQVRSGACEGPREVSC